ncbi:MAG: DUF3846 domain-containing protein [Actinobacteria bacterium]|nr:DUF3846 domain-containing protein [Actinomycetota bacterium]
MKAILIPLDGETTVVEQDGPDDLQRMVDGDLELVDVPGRVDAVAYIDEEGKLSMTPNEAATALLRASLRDDDWIAGACVLTGFDPRDGGNRDVPEDLIRRIVCGDPGLPRPAPVGPRGAADDRRDG